MILHIDFETRSDVDLKKAGLHLYAKGKNTSVWCMAYAFDDEPVQLWTPQQEFPQDVWQHICEFGEVWAHNASFEIAIFNNVVWKLLPNKTFIDPTQTVCTMAMAYAMALPGGLDHCAAALGLTQQKDMEGSRLMIQMSKPREVKEDGTIVWWDSPDKLDRLYRYCIQDIEVERAAGKRMLQLSRYEKRIWALDQTINNRGITVDVKALKNAIDIVVSEKKRLDQEMRRVTKNEVVSCTAIAQLKDFLAFYGVANDSLDKGNVHDLLERSDLDPVAVETLKLRAEAGKASTSKFEPMVTSAGDDGRVRGCFQYSGAGTRRWAGRRIQLHNLKRPSLKAAEIERIVEALGTGITASEIDLYYGSPMSVLSECTRAFLMAAPGHELLACDYSAIEARVLAWLAGQDDILQIFREGKDIYVVAAANIFGKTIDQIIPEERQVGKVAILALGYQGGVGAFQTMAKAYNVKMEPVYDYLMSIAPPEYKIKAEKTWAMSKSRFPDISKKEFIASDLTKIFWRAKNKNIVSYWDELENAAMLAVKNPSQKFDAGPKGRTVTYKKDGSFLWCRLPSGGVICYPYPEIREIKTPWDDTREGLTYMSEEGQGRKWVRFSTYGGSLAENITQATSRDILADAMLRLEDAGYPIVLHVHDEIVCEKKIGQGSLDQMKQLMAQNPKWAKDLPIAVSGWVGARYRK